MHAVSVGEVMAAKKFIEGLLADQPGFHIVLTTVTPTGQKIAKSLESEKVTVCYFPFDVTAAVSSFFEKIRPVCLFLMETEIWPNLLQEASRRNVPVGLLNGRLSEKSAGRYAKFKNIFDPLFSKIAFVLTQSKDDAARFSSLGVPAGKVAVMGNMKFDNVKMTERDPEGILRLRKEWGFAAQDKIIIGGSTHPGEEEILLNVFSRLKKKTANLKLILAPRHIERSGAILTLCGKQNLKAVQASKREARDEFDVLILDQLGVLKHLYAMTDAAFVGGSLVPHGGQNPIEPAACRCPVFHGPYVFNFKQIYGGFDRAEAAVLVQHEEELALKLGQLLGDDRKSSEMAQRAWELVREAQGATDRHLQWVHHFLNPLKQERIENGIDKKLFPQIGGRF